MVGTPAQQFHPGWLFHEWAKQFQTHDAGASTPAFQPITPQLPCLGTFNHLVVEVWGLQEQFVQVGVGASYSLTAQRPDIA